jgi:hypothetical protein
MDERSPFPGPITEPVFIGLLVFLSHVAVLLGGVVRVEPLAWLAAAAKTTGWGAADWWAALLWPFPNAAMVFVVTIAWTLAALVIAYLAVRLIAGPYVALALASGVWIAGYPSWFGALPNEWRFWVTPAAVAAMLAAWGLQRFTQSARERLADRSTRRSVRWALAILMIFAFFVVAEDVRIGIRGAYKGKFPYEKVDLVHGFDKDFTTLRRLHHVLHFVAAVTRMNQVGLRHDSRMACLAGHGEAARFVCRLGLAGSPATQPKRPPTIVGAGWALVPARFGYDAVPGSGGLRNAALRGQLDGVETGNWFGTRGEVWARRPHDVEIVGPVFRRGAGKNLLIDVECERPDGIEVTVTLDWETLPLVRRELAAGDRWIVRFAARLPEPLPVAKPRLYVSAHAPLGMLDFDVFLEGADRGFEPKEDDLFDIPPLPI